MQVDLVHGLGRPRIGIMAGTIVRTIPLQEVKPAISGTLQCMHLFFMAERTVSSGTGFLDHVLGGGVWEKLCHPTQFGAIIAFHPLCDRNVAPARVNWLSTALAYVILSEGIFLAVPAVSALASTLVRVHDVDRVRNPPATGSRDNHCLNSRPIPIMAGMCVLIRGLHNVCKRSLWTLRTLERGTLAPLPFFLWLAGMSLWSCQFVVGTMVWFSSDLHFVRAVAGGKIEQCEREQGRCRRGRQSTTSTVDVVDVSTWLTCRHSQKTSKSAGWNLHVSTISTI